MKRFSALGLLAIAPVSLFAQSPTTRPAFDAFEVATIGNDGFVGLSLVLAGSPSPYQAVVQLPGAAYRINGD